MYIAIIFSKHMEEKGKKINASKTWRREIISVEWRFEGRL